MKKFLYGIIFFFVILIIVFLGVEKRKLTNMELVSEFSGIWQHAGEESRKKEEIDDINVIYGSYKITEFFPTRYYRNMKYDVMPEQEADMLLERIVVIKSEILITYDTERSLGTNGERDAFDGNYMLATYTVNKPEYGWDNLETDILDVYIEPDEDMEQAIGKMYFEQLKEVISTPQLCKPYGRQYFYTLKDRDKLIMFSQLTNQYFLLERCEDELGEKSSEWTEDEKEELLGQIYGEYQVIKFLPTKYYPALDSNGYEILPIEEADMMIGQEIVLNESFFVTYDNYRLPNSYITGRIEDGFMIEKVTVQSPQYQVKSVRCEEIYGICEGMLPEELEQQEYVEIDVYPGYETNGSRVLPQLFLMDDGRIIMYSMGEYFLLNRKGDNPGKEPENDVVYVTENDRDLSEIFEVEMDQASLKKVEDGYELTLYDKDNEKVYSEIYPMPEASVKLPVLNEISKDLLEISISVGSPATYIYFFNKETAEISPTYFNPIAVEEEYIAYMDYDKGSVLVFTDIFQRGEVYIEIERNFTFYVDGIGAIIDIELLDDKNIKIEYYEGEDFTEKTEIVPLNINGTGTVI